MSFLSYSWQFSIIVYITMNRLECVYVFLLPKVMISVGVWSHLSFIILGVIVHLWYINELDEVACHGCPHVTHTEVSRNTSRYTSRGLRLTIPLNHLEQQYNIYKIHVSTPPGILAFKLGVDKSTDVNRFTGLENYAARFSLDATTSLL